MDMNKGYVKPTIALTLIALVAAVLMAVVNGITAPVIAARTEQELSAQRQEVMAEATEFEELTDSSVVAGREDIEACYVALNNGEPIGYVFNVTTNGFGGPMSVTVGVSNDLTVTGLRIGEHSETAGLGSKAGEPKFYEQFAGLSGDPAMTVNEDGAPNNIDGITSATITSRAVTAAAQSACDAAAELVGEGA